MTADVVQRFLKQCPVLCKHRIFEKDAHAFAEHIMARGNGTFRCGIAVHAAFLIGKPLRDKRLCGRFPSHGSKSQQSVHLAGGKTSAVIRPHGFIASDDNTARDGFHPPRLIVSFVFVIDDDNIADPKLFQFGFRTFHGFLFVVQPVGHHQGIAVLFRDALHLRSCFQHCPAVGTPAGPEDDPVSVLLPSREFTDRDRFHILAVKQRFSDVISDFDLLRQIVFRHSQGI